VQRQAEVLADKETLIAALEERLKEAEGAARTHGGALDSNEVQRPPNPSFSSLVDMPDWESLPVPETFKDALEQILMLQVHIALPFLLTVRFSGNFFKIVCTDCSVGPPCHVCR
jgi:hypothetical protein